MKKSIDEVNQVARLARVQLTQEEKEMFSEQLGKILEYIAKLNELDTGSILPTAQVIPLTNVWREDEVFPFTDTDTIINLAPEKEARFFKVAKVID